jgi:polyisoprenoid-binding protein YceI
MFCNTRTHSTISDQNLFYISFNRILMKYFHFLAAVLLLSTTLFAQAGWKLDKAHTGVNFSVKHMVISEVTGNFKEFDITATASKDDFSDLTVTAAIKVASINTDNADRDKHLKSDDFFNAEKFPEITFKSTKVSKAGKNKYNITGDFTIRDITKKVTFNAVFNGTIKSPWGTTVASWKATTTINRFDYNLKWNKALEAGGFVVGKDVNIILNIEMTK